MVYDETHAEEQNEQGEQASPARSATSTSGISPARAKAAAKRAANQEIIQKAPKVVKRQDALINMMLGELNDIAEMPDPESAQQVAQESMARCHRKYEQYKQNGGDRLMELVRDMDEEDDA